MPTIKLVIEPNNKQLGAEVSFDDFFIEDIEEEEEEELIKATLYAYKLIDKIIARRKTIEEQQSKKTND